MRDRHDPVTVIGDETRRPSPLARRAGKGAGSRTIRESGDLPGTRALRTGLRGRPGLPHAISPSRRPRTSRAVSPRTVLVLGGVRAGKSAFAVARARALGGRVAFVATAEAGDEEMAARIARHRAERPSELAHRRGSRWRSCRLSTALEGEADVVVVDCLNLWVANLLDKRPELADSDLLTRGGRSSRPSPRRARPSPSSSSRTRSAGGSIPQTELGRRFRDALGLVNQAVARAADEVVLMVAGCPLVVKARRRAGVARRRRAGRDRPRSSDRLHRRAGRAAGRRGAPAARQPDEAAGEPGAAGGARRPGGRDHRESRAAGRGAGDLHARRRPRRRRRGCERLPPGRHRADGRELRAGRRRGQRPRPPRRGPGRRGGPRRRRDRWPTTRVSSSAASRRARAASRRGRR